MSCRFGLADESLPVAAPAWRKEVWMRPSAAIEFSSPSTVGLSRVVFVELAVDACQQCAVHSDTDGLHLGQDPLNRKLKPAQQ